MQCIPVVDLMSGTVVRAAGGRRAEYRPIESQICESARPGEVVEAFRSHFEATKVYVADLDAIGGAEPDWSSYVEMAAAGVQLWLDAGITSTAGARSLFDRIGTKSLSCLVAGLESLPNPALLQELVQQFGDARVALSVDLRGGVPIVRPADWRELTAEQIVDAAMGLGVRRFIVLDLVQVGMSAGFRTLPLCQAILRRHPNMHVTLGGGVRGPADLTAAQAAGADAVLVATALHNRTITQADIEAVE